jgi:hypothetical protein
MQHIDEQLLRLETRQKALLSQHNIEHSLVREPMDFLLHRSSTTLGRHMVTPPWCMECLRSTLMMRTLVVVRLTRKTPLRLSTPHMVMTIEGPPLFWHLMPKGKWDHYCLCGDVVYRLFYLSIYLRLVDMYELMCVVWWMVKWWTRTFKFVRLMCASVEPIYLCVMLCCVMIVISHFVDLDIMSYASQLLIHLCTCVCKMRRKLLLNVWWAF